LTPRDEKGEMDEVSGERLQAEQGGQWRLDGKDDDCHYHRRHHERLGEDPGHVGMVRTSGRQAPLTGRPVPLFNILRIIQTDSKRLNSKLENGIFMASKYHGKFSSERLSYVEQFYSLVKLPIPHIF
jgi:hypothetical protein